MEWSETEITEVRNLAKELDQHDGVGFINDIEYAQQLSKLLDAYMEAVEQDDIAA